MGRKIKISLRICAIALAVIFVGSCIAYAADTIVKYPSGNWLRKTADTTGYIYEYIDESLFGAGLNHWGKLALAYEKDGKYKTWDWHEADGQVVYTEYAGVYTPTNNADKWSGVVAAERRTSIVYDYHGEISNLNTTTNGWTEREKTIYDTNGTTILRKYLRDTTGRLIKDIYTVAYVDPAFPTIVHPANTYSTYIYHTSSGMENVVHYKSEYTYNEADEAAILGGAEGIFNAQYEYVDTDYMVKREGPLVGGKPTGIITTLLVSLDGSSHNNTYLDPLSSDLNKKNVLLVYSWDASWNILNVKKYYPNGNIEICTPSLADLSNPAANWPVKEKVVSSGNFIKGVNLPWINYGDSLGLLAKDNSHNGFSRNIKQLYDKMDARKGDFVRIFLFTDLRAGIQFDGSGNPIDFTDKVYEDMQALLDAAKALGVKLMPVLFDYTIADGVSGVDVGEHADLISDPVKRQKLLDIFNAFITRFGNDPSIYAWDVMNEPEVASAATMVNLKTFVSSFVNLIHTNAPGSLVTVGSLNRTAMVNNWQSMGLDLYQFHYYDSMAGTNPLNYQASLLGLDKPVIAGELQPTNVVDKLDTLRNNGYAGGLFWEDGTTYTISNPDYTLIQNWYDGVKYTYTYYFPGRLESITNSSADLFGNLYYHYINEDFNGQGYGRVDKQVAAVEDSGAIAYSYEYYPGTNLIHIKYAFHTADYTDPSAPTLNDLLTIVSTSYWGTTTKKYRDESYDPGWVWQWTIQYSESDGTTMQYQWKADANPATPGDEVYYEYDSQGRVSRKVFDTGDFVVTTYWGTTTKKYRDESYDSGWVWQWTIQYSESDGTTMQYQWKADANPATPGDEVFYEYDSLARLVKIHKDDGSFKTFEYYGTTNKKSTVSEFNSSGSLLATYTYYDNAANRLKTKTPATPENGNVYYEYLDEAFNNNGTPLDPSDDFGRVVKYIKSSPDSDGVIAFTNQYYGQGGDLVITSDTTWSSGIYDFNSVTIAAGKTLTITGTAVLYGSISGTGNVNVQNGSFSVPSIKCSTLTIGSGTTMTIAPLPGGPLGGVSTQTPSSSTVYRKYGYRNTNFTDLAATYTFYASGRMQSKVLTLADLSENIYYEYLDEAFFDNGTPLDTSDDFGRTYKTKRAVADSDGCLSFIYSYSGATDRVVQKQSYAGSNFTTLKVTYGYQDNANHRLYTKTLTSADSNDNIYYEYLDEPFYTNGTPLDTSDDFGRTYKTKRAVADSDGCLSFIYSYSGATDRVVQKQSYAGSNFTTLKVTYGYQDNANHRLYTKTLTSADSNDNIYYEYLDEPFYTNGTPLDTSDDFGRTYKTKRAVADSDGCLSFIYSYSGATDRVVQKQSYAGSNFTTLKVTYGYQDNANHRLYTKTLTSADSNDNIYYEYLDEPFYTNGTPLDTSDDFGRTYKTKRAVADSDGCLSFIYSYSGATDRVVQKQSYAGSNFTTLKVTYGYQDNANHRLYTKTLTSADSNDNIYYEYLDEPFYTNGTPLDTSDDFGRTYKTKRAVADSDGCLSFIYSYSGATDRVVQKQSYAGSNFTTLKVTYGYQDNANHRLYTKTLTSADSNDNIYYEYLDEPFYTNGTPLDTSDDFGRTYKTKRAVADSDGCLSFIYSYSGATDRVVQKQSYADLGATTLKLTYGYCDNSTNRLKSKASVLPDARGNNYYEYVDEPFYGTDNPLTTNDERYGRIFKQRSASTGKVIKRLDWYTGTEHVKKEEEYTDLTEATWLETRWFFDGTSGTGRLSKKISSTGEAAKYFDAGQTSDTDYKLDTYWKASGTITHWASITDFDTPNNYKSAWYYNPNYDPITTTALEVYTYYASGLLQYKDLYSLSGSTWTWVAAAGYLDAGGDVTNGDPYGTWDDWKTRAQTGAPLTFTLPTKPSQADLSPLSLQASLIPVVDPALLPAGDQATVDGALAVQGMKTAQTQTTGNYTYSGVQATSSVTANNLRTRP